MNVELHQKLIALGAPGRAPSLHAQVVLSTRLVVQRLSIPSQTLWLEITSCFLDTVLCLLLTDSFSVYLGISTPVILLWKVIFVRK